jgi:hypothetical protein
LGEQKILPRIGRATFIDNPIGLYAKSGERLPRRDGFRHPISKDRTGAAGKDEVRVRIVPRELHRTHHATFHKVFGRRVAGGNDRRIDPASQYDDAIDLWGQPGRG